MTDKQLPQLTGSFVIHGEHLLDGFTIHEAQQAISRMPLFMEVASKAWSERCSRRFLRDVELTQSAWIKFYREVFGIELLESFDVELPKGRQGHSHPIIMHEGVTDELLINRVRQMMGINISSVVGNPAYNHDRHPSQGTYGFLINCSWEVEGPTIGKTLHEIQAAGIKATTVHERMMIELEHLWSQKKGNSPEPPFQVDRDSSRRMDLEKGTACMGSLTETGLTPIYRANMGLVDIDSSAPDRDFVGYREVFVL